MQNLKLIISFPYFNYLKILFSFVFLVFLNQCKKNDIISTNTPKNFPDTEIDTVSKNKIKEPIISYSLFLFPKNKKDSAMAVFNEKFSTEEQKVILALSRLDLKNKWRSDTLVIPNKLNGL